jgi:hypothetical protein
MLLIFKENIQYKKVKHEFFPMPMVSKFYLGQHDVGLKRGM